jgi:primosomal protein N' (replication factor Y) (superfamily II helicase)
MPYAEVSVNSPIAQRRTFSYRIPPDLNIEAGQAVWAPFGDKVLQGVVLEITSQPAVEETKDIAGVIESVPLLTLSQVSLAFWISSYYLAPLFESVALMLPPGFKRRLITLFKYNPEAEELTRSLDPEQKEFLEYVQQNGMVTQNQLAKHFGVKISRKTALQLSYRHLLNKTYKLERPRIGPKIVHFVQLKLSVEEAIKNLETLEKKAAQQARLLRHWIADPRPLALSEIQSKFGITVASIRTLVKRGWLDIRDMRIDRDPLPSTSIRLPFPLTLTLAQESVLQAIRSSINGAIPTGSHPNVFLLHGVTGSGKTEIYLRAMQETVNRGKRGIVLVPEIAMTPQIIEHFVARFPGKVAILHSELSPGEQFDEWWRIKNGEFSVVIGPRSAIFAPQPDLGLIIIDEEHEWTYKQQDISPHYHARQVALKLAEITGATVVLGSATPDVESYYKALSGEYKLLKLTERVTPVEGAPLPQVEVVDLRKELRANNLSIFSRSLLKAMEAAFQNQDQVLLFLNRRGTASFVECRNCGLVLRCKRCEIPLSYHFEEDILLCHQCNYHRKAPQVCPSCKSRKIRYLGIGTEKLEQETGLVFPQARILRWDSDVTKVHGRSHQELFSRFKAGEADVLIGTQMVAKGLDIPGITVVGIVSADIALNLPDFRAGERTFQLLSQVAGRAGRGLHGGKVIIQTYVPEHYAIQAAAMHDYRIFYQKEIAFRREWHNPPFNRLVRMVFSHANNIRCQEETERMQKRLVSEINSRGLSGIHIIGPAPAYIHRLRGRFRWQIILRGSDPSGFLANITFPRGWVLDVDPVGLT